MKPVLRRRATRQPDRDSKCSACQFRRKRKFPRLVNGSRFKTLSTFLKVLFEDLARRFESCLAAFEVFKRHEIARKKWWVKYSDEDQGSCSISVQALAACVSSAKPSSSQPVTPPIMIFTGRPSFARRIAPRVAPLQCGPAQ